MMLRPKEVVCKWVDAFKFRFDLRGSEDSYEESWPGNMPSLSWERGRTYHYNGHNVTADLKV